MLRSITLAHSPWLCQAGSEFLPRLLRDRPPVAHGFRSQRTAEVALRIGRGTAPGSPDRSVGWPDHPGAAFSAESSIDAVGAAV